MKAFNLLPWRETRKRRLDRVMLFAGAMIWIGCAALVLAFRFGVTLQQAHQQQRNDFLARHIDVLDRNIRRITELDEERERLLRRIDIIQDLQHEGILFGNLLQELVRQMPEGVYLRTLIKNDEQLSLTGVALSNARVSDLMSRLEVSPWFTDPRLKEIQSIREQDDRAGGHSRFTLEVSVEPQAGDAS